ncbi:transcriptional regulator with XRE-family HTH domain [Paucibacter oligotrophus]|uniref:Transcriptional regulator with XRE-family HTH domain n=2 Tax=Roseateles oligotrophus TaxID=1769250 RepID=A0A840LCC8_9BURK|nr:transcriptional regulator with XRE-family HTH domain [Roseateles oligotrophus]
MAEQIAQRLKAERKQRGWSLDELAERSRVSRAMISKIERQVSTPTAVLLARLANAMGISLSALMFEAGPTQQTVSRLAEQREWTDPATGYTRRLVSPALRQGDAEIVAVNLPPGARISFPASGALCIDGQLLLQQGQLQLSAGGEQLPLKPGDCARLALHLAHEIYNPGAEVARYLVVIRVNSA